MSDTATIVPHTPEPSFYAKRMQMLGITAEINKIEIYDPEAEFPQPDHQTWPLFAEEKSTGDILISYYTVAGEAIRYLKMGDGATSHINAGSRYYETRRLREPKGDMKYQMPAGQPTIPWFPPALVDKYKKKEEITHLVLTEGVFKAMRGSMAGLDVVGLPSITCYKDRDGKLYSDIVRLIEACRVQHVIVLWDGDCLNISKKDLQVGDELTNRPAIFFNSAKKITELVKGLDFAKTREHPQVWFAHVRPDCLPSRPKGLDDLLCDARSTEKGEETERRIVQELRAAPDKAFYFYIRNITNGIPALHKYFRLHDVEQFYQFHIDAIGEREFKFKGSIHKWSQVENKLLMETPWWAQEIKWVGDEFFIEQTIPGAIRARRVLTHWKEGNFKKLFDKPDFYKSLQHYRGFVNIPDHFNYRQIVETADGLKYYNRYFPFPHVEQEGPCETIIDFVKHIFGEHEVTHAVTGNTYQSWELGLDYIQLLLTRPTQMLPILCLYSPENNTGKSTFGKLLMWMFGDNAIPIGNADLSNDFNETYVDKLLAICDETLLERKKDAERIKALSTNDQVLVNPKGQKQYTIDFFCKFIFTSNNLRMIYVNKHDQRYWIIRVPVLPKDDPAIVEKMRDQIPAFTHMLRRRKMVTGDKPEGRMWFHASLIKTAIFDAMVRVNEPADATNLREQIREWFISDPSLRELRMTMKEIKAEFFSSATASQWIQELIQDYLEADLARDPAGKARFERGYYTKMVVTGDGQGGEEYKAIRKPYIGRPYVFLREKFVSEEDVRYEDSDVPAASAAPAPSAALSHPPVIQTAMQLEATEQPEGEDIPF